jgi:hypothetical protein
LAYVSEIQHQYQIPHLAHAEKGMDLNPYQFRAAWNEFEFARHVVRHEAKLVLMPLAWVTVKDVAEFDKRPTSPDKATLDYWVRRFEPVNASCQPDNGFDDDEETIVVLANRCGREADNLYAGTSCVLGFGREEPHVYAVANRTAVGLIVADTSVRQISVDIRED